MNLEFAFFVVHAHALLPHVFEVAGVTADAFMVHFACPVLVDVKDRAVSFERVLELRHWVTWTALQKPAGVVRAPVAKAHHDSSRAHSILFDDE